MTDIKCVGGKILTDAENTLFSPPAACSIDKITGSQFVQKCITSDDECEDFFKKDFLPQIDVPNQKFYQGLLFSMEVICIGVGVALLIIGTIMGMKYYNNQTENI